MTMQQAIASVNREVTVAAPRERAFSAFVDQIDAWWPRAHHLSADDLAEAVLEPREGGRFGERSVTGEECDWGRVLAYEPPERIVLSWEITPDFTGVTGDPAQGSEIEVRFVEQGPAKTLVELEHRAFERHGDGAEKMREGVGSPGGWGAGLEAYARVAEA